MSEKEVNTISHLLEVEQNASALTSQAQADADKKIAAAKVQADARFQEQFAQIVSDCEASYIEKTSALDNKKSDQISAYKTKISAAGRDVAAFNQFLDSVLFK
ncbi:MAG: hypothetical protein IJ558_03910 [Treponema sp.]|nr:hypothetical protein [Treponema sp.]